MSINTDLFLIEQRFISIAKNFFNETSIPYEVKRFFLFEYELFLDEQSIVFYFLYSCLSK